MGTVTAGSDAVGSSAVPDDSEDATVDLGDWKPPTDFEFPTPPEILQGGYPPEPAYIDPQVEARRARGLPADRSLVASLVQAPDAQRQVHEFGFVLTEEEEDAYVKDEKQYRRLQPTLERIALLEGFAGSEALEVDGKRVLRVMVRADTVAEAESLVHSDGLTGAEIEVVPVRFSLGDLVGITSYIGGNVDALELADIGPEVAHTIEQLRLRQEERPVQIGYSISTYDSPYRDKILIGLDALPADVEELNADVDPLLVAVADYLDADPATGNEPCRQRVCGAVRPGSKISPSCSLGPAVTAGSRRGFLTAGHCYSGGETVSVYRRTASPSSSWSVFTSWSNANVSTTSFNTIDSGTGAYSNNTDFDGILLTAPDYLLTGEINIGLTTTQRILGVDLTLSTSDNVCAFGAVSVSYDCDYISDTSIGYTDANGVHLNDQARVNNLTVSPGDSGGVVARNGYVVGIVQSRHNTTSLNFSKISNADTSLGSAPTVEVGNYAQQQDSFINDMYIIALNRLADSSGHSYHKALISSCTVQNVGSMLQGFMNSAEFVNNIPTSQTDWRQKRIELAYQTILGRPSDTNGMTYWVTLMQTYGWSWSDVVNGFLSSGEFPGRVTSGGAAFNHDIC